MNRHAPTTRDNYVPKLLALGRTAKRDTVYVSDVTHDDWCDALTGLGHCNCDPTVTLTAVPRPSTPRGTPCT